MSTKLVKSKERVRDVGEVFTPDFLVEKMLDQYPEDAWAKHKTWLEPTCGNGQFILGVLRRKLSHGHKILEALDTTFGMDIMPDNILECKQRIYQEFVLPRYKGKNKKHLWKAVCIVENNIVLTEDSLLDDWNNMFCHFNSLPEPKKEEIVDKVNKAIKNIVDVEKRPHPYYQFYKSLLALREDF
jgi:hypothetical protein